jgi:hypothetical protein
MKLKINQFYKGTSKEDQGQVVLTFKTCNPGYEVGTKT